MKTGIVALAGIWLSMGLTGCATIMSGSSQDLSFNSSPDGATVTAGGRVIGKTPITTRLSKESGQTLLFEKDGYKPIRMRLETRLDGWFWGNIVLGGVFGSTTDGITGAVHEYSPSQYMVTLTPEGTTKLEEHTTLSPNQKANEFIVMGYRDIISDLKKGEGQYLSSLLDLLNVKPEDRPDAIKKIRALSEVYTNIAEFSERTVELFNGQSTITTPNTTVPDVATTPVSTTTVASPAVCPYTVSVGKPVTIHLKSGKIKEGKLLRCDSEIRIQSGVFGYTYQFDEIDSVK